MPVLSNVQTALALASASLRYRLTIASVVHRELARWRVQAEQIADVQLRELALGKLASEGFNATAAAMLATLTPRRKRTETVRAIVALEVLFDYLDGRTEPATRPGSVEQSRDLLRWLAAAVDAPDPRDLDRASGPDSRYAGELAATVRRALTDLDRSGVVHERMRGAAQRAIEAQARLHAGQGLDPGELEAWAAARTNGSGLAWREYLAASAASVLAMHALIATSCAEDEQAVAIDRAYMYVGALATLLDGVVDHREDSLARTTSCAGLFASPAQLQATLVDLADRASASTAALRRGMQHRMLLAGLLAYYTTDPGAANEVAKPVVAALGASYGVAPAALLVRRWRALRGTADD